LSTNTIIQIKKSDSNVRPTNGELVSGELAYSFVSDKLFIGNTSGEGVIEIAGYYWLNTTNNAFNRVNAAFASLNTNWTVANTTGNTIGPAVNSNWTVTNTIFDLTNLIFSTTNSEFALQNTVWNHTNGSYDSVNSNWMVSNSIYTQSNNIFGSLNSSWTITNSILVTSNMTMGYLSSNWNVTNTSYSIANSAYGSSNSNWNVTNSVSTVANTARDSLASNWVVTNTAYTVANASNGYATTVGSAANNYSNTTFVKKAGDTISGDLVVTGNIVVSGSTTYANTQQLFIGDNIITLNADLPGDIAPSQNAGIEVNRGSASSNAAFIWNETSDTWQFTSNTLFGVYSIIASQTDANNVGASANSFANTTFVKKTGDTITGDLVVVGNISGNNGIFSGNVSIIDGKYLMAGAYNLLGMAGGNVGLYSPNALGFNTGGISRIYIPAAGGISLGSYAQSWVTPPAAGLIVSGNTGIGTSSPNANLHITGSLLVSNIGANSLTSLYVHPITGNVGIGSSNPSQKLDVGIGPAPVDTFIGIGNAERLRLGYNRTAVPTTIIPAQILADDYGNLHFATRGNYASGMRFYTNPLGTAIVEKIRIDANGNVGIGNTNPVATLQVVRNENNNIASIADIPLRSVLLLRGSTNSVGFISFGEHNSGPFIQGVGTNLLSSKNLFINPFGGNICIGNTNPTKLLSLAGVTGNAGLDITPSGWISKLRFGSIGGRGEDHYWSVNYNPAGSGAVDDANYGTAQILLAGSDSNMAYMSFGVGLSNTAPTERMRITSTGYVGIGTNTPTVPLHVVGPSGTAGIRLNATNQPIIKLTNDTYTSGIDLMMAGLNGYLINRENGHFFFYTNNTSRMVITDTGNIGIGTNSPNGLLTVSGGNLDLRHTSDGNQALRLFSQDGTHRFGLYSSASYVYFQSYNSVPLRFATNALDRMVIGWDGNVGIGVGTASANLHVNGSFLISNTSSNSSPSFYVHPTLGYIGVKTNAPAATLDVNGQVLIRGESGSDLRTRFIVGKASAGSITNGPLYLQYGQSDFVQVGNGSTPSNFYVANGNVGIGTTNPTQLLHLNGGDNTGIKIDNSTPGDSLGLTTSSSGTTGAFVTSSRDMYIRSGYRTYIQPSGGGWATGIYITPMNTFTYGGGGGTFIYASSNWAPTTGSGDFAGYFFQQQITQTGTANGAYTGFKLNLLESSFLGTDGRLVDIQKNSSSVFTIKNSGNVGIGNTNPARRLTVFSDSSVGQGQVRLGYSDSLYWDIGRDNGSDGRFMFIENGTERVTIKNGGIGIGTVNPGANLHVIGSANVSTPNLTVGGTNVIAAFVASYGAANTIWTQANNAFNSVNSNWTVTNAAYTVANAASTVANASNGYATTVGAAANNFANTTFVKKAGDTITGDLVVTGNIVVSGSTTYANTQQLSIGDNILTLNADIPGNIAPSENAGIEVNRGSASSNAAFIWNETSDSWQFTSNTIAGDYSTIASQTDANNVGSAANNFASATYATLTSMSSNWAATNAAWSRANSNTSLTRALSDNSSNNATTNWVHRALFAVRGNISGGGNISYIGGYIKWDQRLIIISDSKGSSSPATYGDYYDIICPTTGNIDVVGTTPVAATASGIPLAAWQALYYDLGDGSGGANGSYHIVSYVTGTADFMIPADWVLIAALNTDVNKVKFSNGVTLRAGETYAYGAYSSYSVPLANNATYLGSWVSTLYPRKNENASITGDWTFASAAAMTLCAAPYRAMYSSTNVYDHYYPSGGNGANNSFAVLRVWSGGGGNAKELIFGGDGTFTWQANTVLTAGNFIPYVASNWAVTNAAYTVANAAFASINSNWTVTNAAYTLANTSNSSLALYPRKAEDTLITGDWKFANYMTLSSHCYRYMYSATDIYDHYYPSGGNGANNTFANLRVWDGPGGTAKLLRFGGDGTFTWQANTVITAGNFATYLAPISSWANTVYASANTRLANTSDVSFNGNLTFPNGNISIGTSNTGQYRLFVNGAFAAVTKSFVIPHPTEPNKQLRYASLEGPENGVYIRGKCEGNFIDLPEYWFYLTDKDSISVHLTAFGGPQNLWVKNIQNNSIEIESADGQTPKFYYTVYGERKDVPKLIVEPEI
jgi:hypothetical protein